MYQQAVTAQVQQGNPGTQRTQSGNRYSSYQSTSSTTLGGLQITAGILAIIFNIAGRIILAANSVVSHGIWCGIFFIVTGSYGIVAGKQKTKCSIVTFMVLSILSAILCIFLLGFSAAGLEDDDNRYCYIGFCFTYGTPDGRQSGRLAINGLLVAVALFEAIIAIWSSGVCCSSVCCGNNRQTAGTVQMVQYVNHPGQPQVVVISGGQPSGQYWAQPVAQPAYAFQPGGTQVHMPHMVQPPAYNQESYTQPTGSYNPPTYYQPTAGPDQQGAAGNNPQAPPMPTKNNAW